MSWSHTEARSWLYTFAWIGAGIAAGAGAVWLVTLIRWDWPRSLAEQQLTILGNTLYGLVGLMALVILGLSIRNAIRNIKGSIGLASFEASSDRMDRRDREPPQPDKEIV